MNDKKRLNSYEDLPLVLDVADIQRIMGISRASAYELVHTPGFPAFQRGIQREKNLKMIPRRYIKTAYLRTSDRNGERSRLWQE